MAPAPYSVHRKQNVTQGSKCLNRSSVFYLKWHLAKNYMLPRPGWLTWEKKPHHDAPLIQSISTQDKRRQRFIGYQPHNHASSLGAFPPLLTDFSAFHIHWSSFWKSIFKLSPGQWSWMLCTLTQYVNTHKRVCRSFIRYTSSHGSFK